MFTILTNKLGWKCHTRDLRLRIQDIPQTPSEKPQTEISVFFARKIHMVCQILSLAENPDLPDSQLS